MCFRFRPLAVAESKLDALNTLLGAGCSTTAASTWALTRYRGRVAFRPAIVNWMTTEDDIDLLVAVIRELGATSTPGEARD